jgi:serine/threonine protein kinase
MWAPELWLADECDGHKLDMWACGLMMYQLVAGALPFDGIDFEQDLDPQRLMFMSDTISEFGRQAGSAARGEAEMPMPASNPDLIFSADLQQLLGGLLQPEPGPRLSAAGAMQQAWCHTEHSVNAARAKVATYESSSLEVRSAMDEGLRAGNPNQWAGRRETVAQGQANGLSVAPLSQTDRSLVPALAPQAKPAGAEDSGEGGDELDAVQAEIAKLKAEMGL